MFARRTVQDHRTRVFKREVEEHRVIFHGPVSVTAHFSCLLERVDVELGSKFEFATEEASMEVFHGRRSVLDHIEN